MPRKTAEQKQWEVQMDADSLLQAATVQSSPTRLRAAKAELKRKETAIRKARTAPAPRKRIVKRKGNKS